MLLRNPFSNTKKFFQKTLQNFKSFFSPGVDYHKLPKTFPYNNPYSFTTTGGGGGGLIDMNAQTSYQQQQQDLENFYSDFTNRWDSSDKSKAKKRNNKKKITMSSTAPTQETKEGNFVQITKDKKSPVKSKIREGDEGDIDKLSKTRSGLTKVEKNRDEDLYLKSKREARSLAVAQKLKEMEMMDMSNVDHVLDIEEVLHYYSRLTCPAYLEIVDKFFMDLYTEFLGPPASPKSVNSRPKFRSVRA